jgi:glutaminyl-peptide cyclotransferase
MRSLRLRRFCVGTILLVLVVLSACGRQDAVFSGSLAYLHVEEQCALGPRLVGSEASRQTASYIEAQLEGRAWSVEFQDFLYRDVPVRNIVGKRGRGPLVILGAHYDTRALADRDSANPLQPVLGANDGASGVAVLLELARVLDVQRAGREIWLVFFDAEDQGGIDGWPFSVGAAYMANNLAAQPEAVIVVDMVGDADQSIYWEGNSDPELLRLLWSVAHDLDYAGSFIPEQRYTIIDDHVPFRLKGFAAVDIIDFDYRYWHTTQDTPDKVSAASLERVGRVLEEWLEQAR